MKVWRTSRGYFSTKELALKNAAKETDPSYFGKREAPVEKFLVLYEGKFYDLSKFEVEVK